MRLIANRASGQVDRRACLSAFPKPGGTRTPAGAATRILGHPGTPGQRLGAGDGLGSVGWFTAMTYENAALVRSLGQIEFLFTIAITCLFFKEKISPRDPETELRDAEKWTQMWSETRSKMAEINQDGQADFKFGRWDSDHPDCA